MKLLAGDVAKLIGNHQDDERRTWTKDGRVRVHIGKIISDLGNKRTVAGRRKRFWEALDGLLPEWTRQGTTYTR